MTTIPIPHPTLHLTVLKFLDGRIEIRLNNTPIEFDLLDSQLQSLIYDRLAKPDPSP